MQHNETNHEQENVLQDEAKKEDLTKEKLEHHVEDLSDRLLRSMAESENIRRRYEKQVEEMKDYCITNFAKDLISVVDNLERAVKFVPENPTQEVKNMLDGIVLTLKEFDNVFSKHGISAIQPNEGDKFDYNLHFAISQVHSDKHPPETVVGLMQVGYKIKDRLLRPASVSVAKAKE